MLQVEYNQLVLWLQIGSKASKDASETDINDHTANSLQNLLGIQFRCTSECSTLLLAMDYLIKSSSYMRSRQSCLLTRGKPQDEFLHQPILLSLSIVWIPAGIALEIEFIGKYKYNIKSTVKEIKSLQAAFFYLK